MCCNGAQTFTAEVVGNGLVQLTFDNSVGGGVGLEVGMVNLVLFKNLSYVIQDIMVFLVEITAEEGEHTYKFNMIYDDKSYSQPVTLHIMGAVMDGTACQEIQIVPASLTHSSIQGYALFSNDSNPPASTTIKMAPLNGSLFAIDTKQLDLANVELGTDNVTYISFLFNLTNVLTQYYFVQFTCVESGVQKVSYVKEQDVFFKEIVNVYADSQELPSFSFVGGKNVDFRIDINNTLHLKNPVVKFIYNDAEVFSAKLTNYTNNFQYTLPVGELRIFVLEESTKPQMYLKHYEFTIDIPGNIGVISPVHEHISVSDESRMNFFFEWTLSEGQGVSFRLEETSLIGIRNATILTDIDVNDLFVMQFNLTAPIEINDPGILKIYAGNGGLSTSYNYFFQPAPPPPPPPDIGEITGGWGLSLPLSSTVGEYQFPIGVTAGQNFDIMLTELSFLMLDNVTVGTNLNATSDLFVALIEVSTSYDLVKGVFDLSIFLGNDVGSKLYSFSFDGLPEITTDGNNVNTGGGNVGVGNATTTPTTTNTTPATTTATTTTTTTPEKEVGACNFTSQDIEGNKLLYCQVGKSICYFALRMTRDVPCHVDLSNGDEMFSANCSPSNITSCLESEVYFSVSFQNNNESVSFHCSEDSATILPSINETSPIEVSNISTTMVNGNVLVNYTSHNNSTTNVYAVLYEGSNVVSHGMCSSDASHLQIPAEKFSPGVQYDLRLFFINSQSLMMISRSLSLMEATSKSMKKFYTYSSMFDNLFPVLIETNLTPLSGVVYNYNWIITEHQSSTIRAQSTNESFLFLNSTKEGCYSVSVAVSSSVTFTAVSEQSFCMAHGMNVSYHINSAQQYQTASVFQLNITDMGKESCIFLDFNDPMDTTQYGLYSIAETLDVVKARCTGKVSSDHSINWRSVESLSATRGIHEILLNHTFSKVKIYDVKFVAVNYVHEEIVTLQVDIRDTQCESPEVQIFGAGISELYPVHLLRSQSYFIESQKQINCISKISKSQWIIHTGYYFDEEFSSSLLTTSEVTTLHLSPNALPYGMYRICVHVEMVIDPVFYKKACGYVNVIATRLLAVIDGGEEVQRSYKFDYFIDASRSMDPDTKSKAGMEFYFLCRTLDDPPFVLTRENITSLGYTYPFLLNPNSPSFVSKGGCYGTGPGRLEAKTTDSKVVLKSIDMIINKMVEITLVVWKGGEIERISNVTQRLTVTLGGPPSLSIRCSSNCHQMINYNEEHMLSGGCTRASECDGGMEFQWLLYLCNKAGYGDELTCDDVPTHKLNEISSLPLNNSLYYGAKARVYEKNRWYKISFRGYRTPFVYGESTMSFFVNTPPEEGVCNTNITNGDVTIDPFKISCDNWNDAHKPLRYTFYAKNKGKTTMFYHGFLNTYDIFPPLGDADNGYDLTIFMEVADKYKATTVRNVTIKVFTIPDISGYVLNLTELVKANDSALQIYAKSGDVTLLSNILTMYTSLVNHNSNNLKQDVEKNLSASDQARHHRNVVNSMKLRDELLKATKDVKVKRTEDVLLLAGNMASVAEYATEISCESQSILNNRSQEFIDILDEDDNVSTELLQGVLANVVEMSGKVLEVSGMSVDVTKNHSQLEPMRTVNNNKNDIAKQSMKQINDSNKVFNKALDILGRRVLPGSAAKTVTSDTINIAFGKVLTTHSSTKVSVEGVGVQFNASMLAPESNDDVTKRANFVSVKARNIKKNFYTFVKSAEDVRSQLTSIEFDSMGGDKVDIEESSQPLILSLKNNALNDNPVNLTMTVKEDNTQWAYQKLTMKNESFRAVIRPLNYSLSLNVYLRKNVRPTPEVYDYIWRIPDNTSCRWKNETKHNDKPINILLDDPNEFKCDRDVNVIFLSDTEELYGDYILALHYYPEADEDLDAEDTEKEGKERRRRNVIDTTKVDEEFCVVIPPPPPTPAPADPPGKWVNVMPVPNNDSIEYGISISTAKCMFWNMTTLQWSTKGCFVGPETTPQKTQCVCNHLTDFGGDVLVAPNPIDFDKVFEGLANLGDNLGVLMVILTIFLLYVVLVIWARKKDKKDEAERGIVTIDCTNGRKKRSSYIATFVTGAGHGAGTTANVYIIISGSKCDSNIIPLKVEGRRLFQARTTTTFRILLPKEIGDLHFIRVFHDNSGPSPSWYLRNIVMTDIATKKQYPFVNDSWLAVESNDGEIEKLLPVASDKELAGFHIVFASTAAKGLLDGHIWFSVLTRPKQSTFTRVQRLSSCLALIFLTMITNAMFFGAGDAPGAKKTIRLGNVVIDLTGIIIGIEASFIVIPPSMLIIEIFRRLKPKPKKNNKEKKVDEESTSREAEEEAIQEHEEEMLQMANQDETTGAETTEENQPFLFPYKFIYLAYTIVFLSSFSSALFTFFYSMMWGKEKSNEWLASMFTGFFQSVLVIQPIKAVITAVLFALILRKPVDQKHAETDDADKSVQPEEIEEDLDGDDDIITADEIPIIRPSESALARARKIKLKERMTWEVIKEIVIYFVFLLVVSRLAYSEKDPNMFMLRRDLKSMFDSAKYSDGGLKLSLVSNPALLYSWLRDTVMPGLFAGPWYNGAPQKDFGFIESRESLRISIPRLRQQRVKKMSCPLNDDMSTIIYHCEAPYSFAEEEEGTYGVGWETQNHTNSRRRRSPWVVNKKDMGESYFKEESHIRERRSSETKYQAMLPGNAGSLRRRKSRKLVGGTAGVYYVTPEALHPDGTVISCLDRWEHFSSEQLKGFPFFGRLAMYSGGGYVANLGYNEQTGWTVVADLHANNWLDKQTRAVFVEFTVYNANVNLFAAAFLYIEVLPTGGAFPFSDFKVFNGYRYALNSNTASRVTELAFLIFVIYFVSKEIKKMIKQKRDYFRGFFNLIEFILLPLYLMMFGLIIFRWLSTARNIREFKENPKDFVSFQYSAEADSMLQGVVGVVAFLLNIKFLKCFQFSKSFYHVGMVMKTFYTPLISFIFIYGIMFFMFAQAGHLSFGAKSENYQTLVRAFVAQFLHILGTTDYDNVRDSHAILGPIYYITYSLFMLFIMFNVFMAIICEAIDDDFEEEYVKNIGDIAIVDFVLKRLKGVIGVAPLADEMSEGTNDYEQAYRKMDVKMSSLELAVQRLYDRIHDDDVQCSKENWEEEDANEEEEKENEEEEGVEKSGDEKVSSISGSMDSLRLQ